MENGEQTTCTVGFIDYQRSANFIAYVAKLAQRCWFPTHRIHTLGSNIYQRAVVFLLRRTVQRTRMPMRETISPGLEPWTKYKPCHGDRRANYLYCGLHRLSTQRQIHRRCRKARVTVLVPHPSNTHSRQRRISEECATSAIASLPMERMSNSSF